MPQGVLAAGSESRKETLITRAVAAVVLVAAAAMVLLVPHDVPRIIGLLLGALAVVVLAVNEVVAASRRAARRWVVDTGSGFRWTGGPDEFEVRDEQVIAVRYDVRRKYAAGLLKLVIRRFAVWTEGAAEPVEMVTRIAPDTSDPLEAMIDRIIEDLKRRAAAGLAGGQPLVGDDWSLKLGELTLRRGNALATVPFAEIDKVGLFDGKLCVWRRGEDEPAAKIDPASRNAPVLGALLGEWTAQRQETSAEEAAPAGAPGRDGSPDESPAASDLGRVLFERRKVKMAWGLAITAAACLVGGVVLVGFRDLWIFSLALWPIAAGVAYAAWGWSAFLFRCHERGLYRRWGKKETRMAYGEITEFTYSAVRHFHNGAYVGTQFSMKFVSPGGNIGYSATINSPDEELDNLRDHIAKVVAHRMMCELKQGRPAAWTADMRFLPNGLQFRRAKALGMGRKPPEVLPYDQIRGIDMKDGVFYLWNKTEPKPIISTAVSTPNFFPGFFVILMRDEIGQAGD